MQGLWTSWTAPFELCLHLTGSWSLSGWTSQVLGHQPCSLLSKGRIWGQRLQVPSKMKTLGQGGEGTAGFHIPLVRWAPCSIRMDVVYGRPERNHLKLCPGAKPILPGSKSKTTVSWDPLQFSIHARHMECSLSNSLGGRSRCVPPPKMCNHVCATLLCQEDCANKAFHTQHSVWPDITSRHCFLLSLLLFDFCWSNVKIQEPLRPLSLNLFSFIMASFRSSHF